MGLTAPADIATIRSPTRRGRRRSALRIRPSSSDPVLHVCDEGRLDDVHRLELDGLLEAGGQPLAAAEDKRAIEIVSTSAHQLSSVWRIVAPPASATFLSLAADLARPSARSRP